MLYPIARNGKTSWKINYVHDSVKPTMYVLVILTVLTLLHKKKITRVQLLTFHHRIFSGEYTNRLARNLRD